MTRNLNPFPGPFPPPLPLFLSHLPSFLLISHPSSCSSFIPPSFSSSFRHRLLFSAFRSLCLLVVRRLVVSSSRRLVFHLLFICLCQSRRSLLAVITRLSAFGQWHTPPCGLSRSYFAVRTPRALRRITAAMRAAARITSAPERCRVSVARRRPVCLAAESRIV